MLAGGGFSILARVKEVPGAAGDEELRARALLRLVPAQVHHLRNALVVVQGAIELAPREDTLASAREKLRVLAESLERLARFARAPSAHPEARGLRDLFRVLEVLLRPLERSGIELELRPPAPVVVRSDGGLEALLVALCVALLEREPGQRRGLRLGARVWPQGLHLVLHARGDPPAPQETEALLEHARARGWPAVTRRSTGRLSLRLRLPLEAGAGPATTPARRSAPRGVLLLHRERAERELAGAVLTEQGYRVHAASEAPLGERGASPLDLDGPFDLALVERGLLERDPQLGARLRAHLGLARVEPLDDRMRPEELLALVTRPR